MNRVHRSAAVDSGSELRLPQYRFGIGLCLMQEPAWHAVDLQLYGPRMLDSQARGVHYSEVDVFSVCGVRAQYVRLAGQFGYNSSFLDKHRCERCGWVVALNRGTVEQEIELHTGTARRADHGLLRQIFTAILADVAPGRDAEAGHRSDLLAHAARHRPVLAVCQDCSYSRSAAEVHGPGVTACATPVLVCGSCTFTGGLWAGERAGVSTGDCVVAAPCSVLVTLARHYDVVVDRPWGLR
ncbi:hypothetical protein [Mycobacterium intracellulare]|uniref:hypothetical protein n=1 Tax=Mycobacterium intracellulare TaxID=1767 RepID=UPI001EEE015E|nr:hypothetical protein [Mycobacterium intracellulare]MEE3755237.1 hypothetical protein [Mycobacterium intracellulare]